MSKKPLISVIMPVYNVENHIKKSIDSVFNQNFTDFELICVDDGSTDMSGKICDEYANKDNRLRVFHKDNGGVASARQFGIEKIEGDFFIFIDSDDYIEFDMFKNMYEIAMKSDSDVVYCDYFEEKDNIKIPKYQISVTSPIEMVEAIFSDIMAGYLWNKIFKTSILKENHVLFQKGIDYGEDQLFVVRMLLFCKNVSYCNKLFYHYVFRENSIMNVCKSKHKYEMQKKCLNEFIKISKFYKLNLLPKLLHYKCEMIFSGYFTKKECNEFGFVRYVDLLNSKIDLKNKLLLLFAKIGFFVTAQRLMVFYKKYLKSFYISYVQRFL